MHEYMQKDPAQANRVLQNGGADEIRTHDLLRAREALSQLSHSPKKRQYYTIRMSLSQSALADYVG